MAVVLPNPRKWNPSGPSPYVARRARVVYNIMLKRGIFIPTYEEVILPEREEAGAAEQVPGSIEKQEIQHDIQNPESSYQGDGPAK
jgi:monofunctional biosynthetic peptidoglycan transglycosylase